MKTLVLVLTAIFALTLPTLAGPLTGAPAIRFEVGAPEGGAAAPGNWSLGVGFTTFNFNFEQTVGATKFGDKWSQSGPIVSAEYSKPLNEGKAFAFGGWIAPLGSDSGNPALTVGELHGRYEFNPNWGVEVGGLLGDASQIGTMLLHAVYQTESSGAKPLKFQAGLGVLTGTKVDFGGKPLGEWGTGLSAFSNVSYPFSQAISGYFSAWLLSQKFQWNTTTVGASIPDLTSTTLQWSLGASHSF